MLRQAQNTVYIEGLVSEIDLAAATIKKDGHDAECIRGTVKIRVHQIINNENKTLEIPVQVFSMKYKNNGEPNPAYTSTKQVMEEYVSIAAAGVEKADGIRIKNATLQMNEYYAPNGNLVSYPRISSSFFTRISRDQMKEEATFTIEFVVANKRYETDNDGVETSKYRIQGIVPQYGGKADIFEFNSYNPNVINSIDRFWNPNDTVKALGKINFSTQTKTVTIPVDFGEPQQRIETISVSELLITGGSNSPLEGEFAFDIDEVADALAKRKEKLEEDKNKASTMPKPSKSLNLGF